VRELRNVIERAVALTSGESIVPDDLPEYLCERVTKIFSNPTQGTGLRELERQYILRVLTESPSLEHAAATLGINVTTLWRKRKRYGI
jgi:transcriptional regulator with PAS, ATPase and Fis domain